jgi:hypothetical protein
MNSETKQCQNCKHDFLIGPDDFAFYAKMGVPAPSWCSECRQMRRMMFRNFKTLYKRPSSKSGKSIISMYSPDVAFPVYEASEWYQDDWDGLDYGREYDPTRPFFEQLKELHSVVPRMALMDAKSTDCEYANMTLRSSKCYLVFGCVEDEECDYGHIVWNSKNCVDNLYIMKCEFCYECSDCLNCNQLFYSQECESCADSVGLFDCRGCTDCIGCVGLRSKSHYIFNKPVSKEAYKEFLTEHPMSDPATIIYIKEKVAELQNNIPKPEFFGSKNVDVSGNHIYNAHNVHHSFDVKSGENSKYGYTTNKFIDSYDIAFTPSIEKSYESLTSTGSDIIGSQIIVDSAYVSYSDSCFSCQNIFGCAGLRQKSYCILNKQYTKEEYEDLVPKIIEQMKKDGEWGEFMPVSISPFAYNESIVNEYMPKEKEEVLALGFKWKDNIPSTTGQETIAHEMLPKDPESYDAKKLVTEILKCTSCSKNYKLIDREIAFYKRYKLPIPIECFNCRHKARMNLRPARFLRDSVCDKCGKQIKTSYKLDPNKQEKVYCTPCYQQEVV